MRLRLRGEDGLVGKAAVVILVFVVLLGIAAIDGISIVLTTLRASTASETAAVTGAATLKRTNSAETAVRAALGEVQADFPEARPCSPQAKRLKGCDILVRTNRLTGEVTVIVKQVAATFVVGKVSFLEDLGIVREEATAAPPKV
jgi:hypothetical protein